MLTRSDLAYRQTSAEGATYIGLLLALYDTLADDLRRAAVAISSADIPTRCTRSNHALLVLGHLETWARELDDPTLAASLSSFYAYLRQQIMASQANPHPEPLQALASLVAETRASWHRKEQNQLQAKLQNPSLTPSPSAEPVNPPHPPTRLSWSA